MTASVGREMSQAGDGCQLQIHLHEIHLHAVDGRLVRQKPLGDHTSQSRPVICSRKWKHRSGSLEQRLLGTLMPHKALTTLVA